MLIKLTELHKGQRKYKHTL